MHRVLVLASLQDLNQPITSSYAPTASISLLSPLDYYQTPFGWPIGRLSRQQEFKLNSSQLQLIMHNKHSLDNNEVFEPIILAWHLIFIFPNGSRIVLTVLPVLFRYQTLLYDPWIFSISYERNTEHSCISWSLVLC